MKMVMILLWFKYVPEGSIYYIFISGASSFSKTLTIIKVLRKRYGDIIVRKVREFEKLDFKYSKVLLGIDFWNTCLKYNIIPKFVQFCISNKDLKNSTAYKQYQIKVLKQEISKNKRNLRTLRRDVTSVRNELPFFLSFFLF